MEKECQYKAGRHLLVLMVLVVVVVLLLVVVVLSGSLTMVELVGEDPFFTSWLRYCPDSFIFIIVATVTTATTTRIAATTPMTFLLILSDSENILGNCKQLPNMEFSSNSLTDNSFDKDNPLKQVL